MKKRIITFLAISMSVFIFFTKVRSNNTKHIGFNNMVSDSAASYNRGKLLYKTYCISCHQFDGGGVENMNPPLIQTPYVLGNKSRLISIVLKGFNKRVEIGGDSYSNNMPPLNYLTNQQIADVLTYVRNDFGNKASAVKIIEVKTVRSSK